MYKKCCTSEVDDIYRFCIKGLCVYGLIGCPPLSYLRELNCVSQMITCLHYFRLKNKYCMQTKHAILFGGKLYRQDNMVSSFFFCDVDLQFYWLRVNVLYLKKKKFEFEWKLKNFRTLKFCLIGKSSYDINNFSNDYNIYSACANYFFVFFICFSPLKVWGYNLKNGYLVSLKRNKAL